MRHIILKVFFIVLLLFPFLTHAGAEHNMSGWAWSSNIGWVSFNSTNTGGTVNYGVNKNADGTLSGYAWSSNVGWVQFGGLSGFPSSSGNGTTFDNAKMSGNNLVGWARVLSYGPSLDGWIALSGTGYGVTQVGNNFTNYSWGDLVVGWLRFDPTNCSNCGVTTTPNPQCSDGSDNDLDGLTDFPNDPGCDSALDNDERNQCSDGIDNADPEDTIADYPNDPGCSDPQDNNEVDGLGWNLSISAVPPTLKIKFPISGGASTEEGELCVTPTGGLEGDVTISYESAAPPLPAPLIKFDRGVFVPSTPSPTVVTTILPGGSGSCVYVQLQFPTSFTGVRDFTFRATRGIYTNTGILKVDPTLKPIFEEI